MSNFKIIVVNKDKDDYETFIEKYKGAKKNFGEYSFGDGIQNVTYRFNEISENISAIYFSKLNGKLFRKTPFDYLTNQDTSDPSITKMDLINNIIGNICSRKNEDTQLIIAVHWGGKENNEAQELINKLNTNLEKRSNLSFRFAYYSSNLSLTVDDLKNIFLDQIQWLTKKNEIKDLYKDALNFWIPLILDIKGLLEIPEGNTEQRIDYYNYIKNRIIHNNTEIFTKGVDTTNNNNILNNVSDIKLPMDIVKCIINDEYKTFIKNYEILKVKDLSSWLQKYYNLGMSH
ncbi:MAG: hypothetical protein V1773_07070 [bacterium]